MTPEAQRIAIAEACGWTRYRNQNSPCGADIPEGERILWEYYFIPPEFKGDPAHWRVVPDYTSDLNVMREVEEWISGGWEEPLTKQYVRQLREVVYFDADDPEHETQWWMIHATAAQRAEAFLRTIGKWID